MNPTDPGEVRRYWFAEPSDREEVVRRNYSRWSRHGARLDDEIRERFRQ